MGATEDCPGGATVFCGTKGGDVAARGQSRGVWVAPLGSRGAREEGQQGDGVKEEAEQGDAGEGDPALKQSPSGTGKRDRG